MLYAITLKYGSDPEALGHHLDAHKIWLAEMIKKGNVIFAGLLQNKQGGFILAYADELTALEKEIHRDPFVTFGLVDVDILVVDPAVCSSAFPDVWATNAKKI